MIKFKNNGRFTPYVLSRALVALLVFSAFSVADESSFGRFVGTFRNDKTKVEQLAKLDFAVARSAQDQLELYAVLTLHFGDFDSGEYVAFHFDGVRYVLPGGVLIFNSDDQPLSFISSHFSAESGELRARIRTKWTGEAGELILKRDGVAQPKLPLVAALGAEYTGQCEGRKTKLQLHPFRSDKSITATGNPFSAYEIRGQMLNRTLYGNEFGVVALITSGSYNFFTGKLKLVSRQEVLDCSVSADRLQCGACDFTRSLPVVPKKEMYQPPTSPEAFPTIIRSVAHETLGDSLQAGTYSGFVHHEYLNEYQRVNLDLSVFPDGASTKLSATGSLFFGDSGLSNGESIPLQFEEQVFPNPLGSQGVLLKNKGSDIDAVVQLSPAGAGVIRGVWFSQIFGRVGTFEIRQNGLPILPIDARVFEKVSGKYRGQNWNIDLGVREENIPVNTVNPFAPNLFMGSFRVPSLTYNRLITGGSFDYYTGRIAFQLEVSENTSGGAPRPSRVFIGQRDSRQRMSLASAVSVWGVGSDYEYETFQLVKE